MTKLRKPVKLLLFAIPLTITAFGCYKAINKETNKLIKFQDIVNIEYGDYVETQSFLEKTNGEVVKYPNLSTYELGLKEMEYSVKFNNKTYDVKKTVQIVDTQLPIIELMLERVEIEKNSVFESLSNIERVYDAVDGDLSTYSIIHDVDTSIPGDYEVIIKATDKNKNAQIAKYTVSVKESDDIAEEKKENQLRYIENILFINKKYSLPSSYKGEDKEALNALVKLQEAARNAGHELSILSDYISYSEQKKMYDETVKNQGYEIANKTIEKAGHSEHQAGLAFDIGSSDENFGESEAGKWLAEHCSEYGFIIRYPKGKEKITGYEYSPSHIRYVGEKHAKLIHQWNITLEEYLGVEVK